MELKNIINKLNDKIENLECKLNDIENENKNIKIENIKLKNENNNLSQTKNLQNKLNEEENNNIIKNINLNNNNNNSNDKIIIEELNEKLETINKEVKELKNKIEYNSNNIDNFMTVIFYSTDQKIHYSLICKETDKFSTIENKLYEAYPECQGFEYYFMVNGQKIKKFETLKENKIKNSQIITLNQNIFE